MRKEFLGPYPVVLGALIVVVALLSAGRAPPLPCACPLYSPDELVKEDAAGYPHVANSSSIFVDGQVERITPEPALPFPYRHVTMRGAGIVFNVTGLDPQLAPPGTWIRISANHIGQAESGGPDGGHRWAYIGPTAPPSGEIVRLSELSAGLALVLWGAATWKRFPQARLSAFTLGARLHNAGEAARNDPTLGQSAAGADLLKATRRAVFRGQYEAAEESLSVFEARQRRSAEFDEGADSAEAEARRWGEALGTPRKANEHAARARELRVKGELDEAEKELALALEELAAGERAAAILPDAKSAIWQNKGLGVEDAVVNRDFEAGNALLAAGSWVEAREKIESALSRAREASPGAGRARLEMEALDEAMRKNPAADRTREVRESARSAVMAYAVGSFAESAADARVARWLADEEALDDESFRRIAESAWRGQGYALARSARGAPSSGFLVERDGVLTLLVSATWREAPTERVIFAVKDYLKAGGAQRALIFSATYADFGGDDRIEAVDPKRVAEMLRAEALRQVEAEAASARA